MILRPTDHFLHILGRVDVYGKRDENKHLAKSACCNRSSQLLLMEVFTRIVRAAGDCSREDYHAVYGIFQRDVGMKILENAENLVPKELTEQHPDYTGSP